MADRELSYQPLNIKIAADARTGRTDYANDTAWEVAFGQKADEPAFSLQTRYGGRVGLARLVPMIAINNRTIYEKGAFVDSVIPTIIAPDTVQLRASPVEGIELIFSAWVMDSHTLGGQFDVLNETDSPLEVAIQIFFQGMRTEKALRMNLLNLEMQKGKAVALSIEGGQISNLEPVLIMQNARETGTAKLDSPLQLTAGGQGIVRFVHVALPERDKSIAAAYDGLKQANWQAHFKVIKSRARSLPEIDTGDDSLDAAILFSQQTLLRCLVAPTNRLPYATPVFSRTSATGYSPKGDGSDHVRAWSGQNAFDTFQYAASLAVLEPKTAEGIVKNYVAVQNLDGGINGNPGAGGQQAGYLLPPILAQLSEIVYFYGGSVDFVKEVFPKLVKFYTRWFAAEADADRDGFPEWQAEHQTGYDVHPLFSINAYGAPPADPLLVEAPDLAAYLLNEGAALMRLAEIAGGKTNIKPVEAAHKKLEESLQKSWSSDAGGRFYYRDRDSDMPLFGQSIFKGKGDSTMPGAYALQSPNRLVIRVEGGVSHRPAVRVTINGLTVNGKNATEILESENFNWYRGAGAAISHTVWTEIQSLRVEGLSRVYDYRVDAMDITRHDISLLMPYITGNLDKKQRRAIMQDMEARYLHEFGLSTLPTDDPEYRSPASNGRHAMLPWITMLGLAMLRHGDENASAELFGRIASAQTQSLIQQGSFFQWYNAEDGGGLGIADHTSGVISLHWLMQLIGVYVRDAGTVEIFAPFSLRRGVRLTWHGVRVARTNRSLKIKFPSKHTVELASDAPLQTVTDPNFQGKSG